MSLTKRKWRAIQNVSLYTISASGFQGLDIYTDTNRDIYTIEWQHGKRACTRMYATNDLATFLHIY